MINFRKLTKLLPREIEFEKYVWFDVISPS